MKLNLPGSKVKGQKHDTLTLTLVNFTIHTLYPFAIKCKVLCSYVPPPCNMQSYAFLSLLPRASQNPVGSAPSSHSRMVTLLLLWRPVSRGQLHKDKSVTVTDDGANNTENLNRPYVSRFLINRHWLLSRDFLSLTVL